MERLKENKDDAVYGIGHAPPKERCALCIHFQEVPGTNPRTGVCDAVNGMIDPKFWCMNFIPLRPTPKK